MLFSSAITSIAVAFVSGGNPSLMESVLLLAIASLGVVICDLLMEASYSEQLRDSRKVSGNNIVIFVWIAVTIGSGIAAILAGSLSDAGYIKQAVAIAAPFPLLFVGFVGAGWVPEKKATFAVSKLKQGCPSITMSVCMALAAIVCGIVLFESPIAIQVVIAVLCSIVVFGVARLALPHTIFMCNIYMFLVEAMTVNYVGVSVSCFFKCIVI